MKWSRDRDPGTQKLVHLESCHSGNGLSGVPTRPALNDRLGRHSSLDEEGGHVSNLVKISVNSATDNDDFRHFISPQPMGVRQAGGQLWAGPSWKGLAPENDKGWMHSGLVCVNNWL